MILQVLLMLTSDLDSEEDKDRAALDSLLTVLLKELDLSGKVSQNVSCSLITLLRDVERSVF